MNKLVMLCATFVVLVQLLAIPAPVNAATTWGPDVRLTNAAGTSYYPMVAISGSNVHVVWQDNRDGNHEIYYKRSLDNGVTWGADVRLTNAVEDSRSPAIAVSGSTIHVAWYDHRNTTNYEIFYKRSLDNGTTWGPDIPMTNNLGWNANPRLATSGNSVYLVWDSNTGFGWNRIWYAKSLDGGGTWGTAAALTPDGINSNRPDITIVGNTIHLAYDGRSPLQIFYRRSLDAGTTWDPEIQLTVGGLDRYQPSLAVSGQYVHVFWFDTTPGNAEIFYARSTGGGAAGSWGTPYRLTNAIQSSANPRAAVEQMNVHVAWQDERELRNSVFYNNSTDNGGTWSTDARLTSNDHYALSPDLAAATGNLHLVWYDDRSGDYEIYYRRGTTPLPVPTIASINPNQGIQGQTLDNVIITGANFTGATAVAFGNGISVNSFSVISDRQIRVNISINLMTTSGARDVSVTTPYGTGRLNNGFTVISSPKTTSHSATIAATPQGPVSLPSISVKSASLSASKVAPGAPVTVTANVANTGAVNGATRITVYVNGQEESTQGITVNSGSNTPITFNVSRSEPGTYTVYVGGANAGSFVVDALADPGIIALGIGVLFLIIFTAGLIIYRRRSHLSPRA